MDLITKLQVRWHFEDNSRAPDKMGVEDNSKIIFLISQ